ncbi:hypothetical protein C2U71_09705 [Burkholderia ubonensis]|nr:hypothetical protein C2U71_09705 [Burkholderia ubonensis]
MPARATPRSDASARATVRGFGVRKATFEGGLFVFWGGGGCGCGCRCSCGCGCGCGCGSGGVCGGGCGRRCC